jgi:pimeloyl-ACP methyl ester carboxylesterase
MNVFAKYGFDVWTMDHEGYGRSSRTDGNSDVKSGVEDLKAGLDVVARETGAHKAHFIGVSSGALRAGCYAMERPDRVDRLILCAPTYKGTGSPTLANRAEQIEYYRKNNTRPRGRIEIERLFTRDREGVADPRLAKARADRDLPFGDRVPSGTYLDMVANLPLLDPKRILAPVLLVRGEHDGIATVEDLSDFYNRLPNGDRQFVILPGVAHSVQLAYNRELFWHVARNFLTMPARIV